MKSLILFLCNMARNQTTSTMIQVMCERIRIFCFLILLATILLSTTSMTTIRTHYDVTLIVQAAKIPTAPAAVRNVRQVQQQPFQPKASSSSLSSSERRNRNDSNNANTKLDDNNTWKSSSTLSSRDRNYNHHIYKTDTFTYGKYHGAQEEDNHHHHHHHHGVDPEEGIAIKTPKNSRRSISEQQVQHQDMIDTHNDLRSRYHHLLDKQKSLSKSHRNQLLSKQSQEEEKDSITSPTQLPSSISQIKDTTMMYSNPTPYPRRHLVNDEITSSPSSFSPIKPTQSYFTTTSTLRTTTTKQPSPRLLQIPCSITEQQFHLHDTQSSSTNKVPTTPMNIFIDTGAQVTLMTYDAAKRAGITHLIDTSHRQKYRICGVAGTSCKVVGCIPSHSISFLFPTVATTSASTTRGEDEEQVSSSSKHTRHQQRRRDYSRILQEEDNTVRIDECPSIIIIQGGSNGMMEHHHGIDMLLGLDVLETWQASICLRDRILKVDLSTTTTTSSSTESTISSSKFSNHDSRTGTRIKASSRSIRIPFLNHDSIHHDITTKTSSEESRSSRSSSSVRNTSISGYSPISRKNEMEDRILLQQQLRKNHCNGNDDDNDDDYDESFSKHQQEEEYIEADIDDDLDDDYFDFSDDDSSSGFDLSGV